MCNVSNRILFKHLLKELRENKPPMGCIDLSAPDFERFGSPPVLGDLGGDSGRYLSGRYLIAVPLLVRIFCNRSIILT
jgi:hypothetical protein